MNEWNRRCPECGSVCFTKRQPGDPVGGLPETADLYRCDGRNCDATFEEPLDLLER